MSQHRGFSIRNGNSSRESKEERVGLRTHYPALARILSVALNFLHAICLISFLNFFFLFALSPSFFTPFLFSKKVFLPQPPHPLFLSSSLHHLSSFLIFIVFLFSSSYSAPTKIDTEPKVERPKAAAVHRKPVSISSSASTSPSSSGKTGKSRWALGKLQNGQQNVTP